MKLTVKLLSLVLCLCILLCCFGALCIAEEGEAPDLTVYNGNTKLFCDVLRVIGLSEYGESDTENAELAALYKRAHMIIKSGRYNPEYPAFEAAYAIYSRAEGTVAQITADISKEVEADILDCYAQIFMQDTEYSKKLELTGYVLSLFAEYSEFIDTEKQDIAFIKNFCTDYFENIKADGRYSATHSANLSALSEGLAELDGATAEELTAKHGELMRLYSACEMGRGLSAADAELYRKLTDRVADIATAKAVFFRTLSIYESVKGSRDAQYDILTACYSRLAFLDASQTDVAQAIEIFEGYAEAYDSSVTVANSEFSDAKTAASGLHKSDATPSDEQ